MYPSNYIFIYNFHIILSIDYLVFFHYLNKGAGPAAPRGAGYRVICSGYSYPTNVTWHYFFRDFLVQIRRTKSWRNSGIILCKIKVVIGKSSPITFL